MVFYALVVLGLFSYAMADLVTTPGHAVRTLPKPLWFLVVLPPLFGPIAWLLVGRPRKGAKGGKTATPQPPLRAVAPDDDEEFLRELRRRSRDPRDDAA